MKPAIIVIDLDETICHFDESCIINFFPKYYLRDNAFEFLKMLRQLHRDNILILWSAAREPYVTDFLFQTNLGNYFNYILTREHCKTCSKMFDTMKDANYILQYLEKRYTNDEMSKIKNYELILLDDKASQNGGQTYDLELNIPPYNAKVVKRELENCFFRDNNLQLLTAFFFDRAFLKYFNNKIYS
jgi:hypothetical protein